MEWIRENWVFLLFFILFIAMHLFGHSMHGGGCGGHRKNEEEEHKGHDEGSTEKREKQGDRGCC